ncbi:MAG: HesA/MoeB/ThiF family protein [Tissierellales bacterium]|jgi:molybdopterin/thiamine biosynthesis adenylyltransferase|nr:HesA/MoeB/ThiF family protein [Tissierellales bacterium]
MRYARNGIFSKEDMDILKSSSVAVIGCGGLGGYIAEMLCRVGVGELILVDGDVFDETNLNRQILSTTRNINESKAVAAKRRLESIDPEICIKLWETYLDENNGNQIVQSCNVVVDALDSINTRFLLQDICEVEKIPMVHGAIAGWYGQVATIYPGDKLLNRVYNSKKKDGIEKKIGNPSFTPAQVASIQVSEVIKILLRRGEILRNEILYIDLLSNEYERIKF